VRAWEKVGVDHVAVEPERLHHGGQQLDLPGPGRSDLDRTPHGQIAGRAHDHASQLAGIEAVGDGGVAHLHPPGVCEPAHVGPVLLRPFPGLRVPTGPKELPVQPLHPILQHQPAMPAPLSVLGRC